MHFIYKCVYTCMYRNVHTIHIYIGRERQTDRGRDRDRREGEGRQY